MASPMGFPLASRALALLFRTAGAAAHHIIWLSAGVVLIGGAVYLLSSSRRFVAWVRRGVTRFAIKAPQVPPNLIKGEVFATPIETRHQPAENHTHAESAEGRALARRWIKRQCTAIGRTPYFVQASAQDVRHGQAYSMEWHWVRDVSIEQTAFAPPSDAVVVLVDTDYYAPLDTWVKDWETPLALYTFTPLTAGSAKHGREYAYKFEEDGDVCVRVTGGTPFRHGLWDLSHDNVVIPHEGGDVCYMVERRLVSVEHSVIWLFPVCRYRYGTRWVLDWLGWSLGGHTLKRFNPVKDGFVRFEVSRPDGLAISTAHTGSYGSATVLASIDSAIQAAAQSTTGALNNYTVESYGVDKEVAIFLTEYHRAHKPRKLPCVIATDWPVNRYQSGPTLDVDASPAVVPFMRPIVSGGAWSPDVCEGNMAAGIKHRIIDLADNTEPTRFVSDCMEEFIELLLRKARITRHSLHPATMEDIESRLTRPQQRRMTEEAGVGVDKGQSGSSFMKREVYPEIKDPRVIAAFRAFDKTKLAQLFRPLHSLLVDQDFYAFVEPAKLTERLVRHCTGARHLWETDFNRMDGRIGPVPRMLEVAASLAVLALEHHDAFLKAHKRDHHKKFHAAIALVYFTLYQRLSGSPSTSDANTLVAAFNQFLAYRLTTRDWTGLGPEEAFAAIGPCGGDDGLMAPLPGFPQYNMERAAKLLGQVVKIVAVNRGSPASFLGRFYYPWSGSPNSCSDILRQLRKFHLTTDKQALPLNKFIEKALALAWSDINTPILGSLGRKALYLKQWYDVDEAAWLLKPADNCISWNLRAFLLNQVPFPNEHESWMDDLVEKQMPGFDHKAFEVWVESGSILFPPVCHAINCPRPVIDEVIHQPTMTEEDLASLRKESAAITAAVGPIANNNNAVHALSDGDRPVERASGAT